MIVDNLDVFGVAVAETENQSPRTVDRYRPLPLPVAMKRMQTDRIQRRNVFERPCGPQKLQPQKGFGDVHAGELRFAFQSEALGRTVGIAFNHMSSVT